MPCDAIREYDTSWFTTTMDLDLFCEALTSLGYTVVRNDKKNTVQLSDETVFGLYTGCGTLTLQYRTSGDPAALDTRLEDIRLAYVTTVISTAAQRFGWTPQDTTTPGEIMLVRN
jgi:hypothetical protein